MWESQRDEEDVLSLPHQLFTLKFIHYFRQASGLLVVISHFIMDWIRCVFDVQIAKMHKRSIVFLQSKSLQLSCAQVFVVRISVDLS